MSLSLLHNLLESSPTLFPYSSDRFNKIVNEIEENDTESIINHSKVEGPSDQFKTFLSNWLENLMATHDTEELDPSWREFLSKFITKNPGCGDFLPMWGSRILKDLEPHVKPDTFLTIWESLNVGLRYADRCIQMDILRTNAEEIAKTAVTDFQNIYPTLETDDDFSDFSNLQHKLSELLTKWVDENISEPSLMQELEFLRLFSEMILPIHNGNEQFWFGFILLNFKRVVDDYLSVYPQNVLTDCLQILEDVNSRFDCLTNIEEEFPILLDCDDGGNYDEFLQVLLLTMILNAGTGSSLKNRFLASISRDAFSGELGDIVESFTSQKPKLVDWLRARYERVFVDWFEDTVDFYLKLKADAKGIEETFDTMKQPLQRLGDDLAVGIKGQNVSRRATYLFNEILTRAMWASSVTHDLKLAGNHFRRSLIDNMGLDLGNDIWRKHNQVQASLINLIEGNEFGKHAEAAIPLLRTVDTMASATRFNTEELGIADRVIERADLDSALLNPEDVQLLIKRFLIDSKLYSGKSSVDATKSWFFDFQLSRLGVVNGDRIRGVLRAVFSGVENPRGGAVPQGIEKSLEKFLSELPELTGSLTLRSRADEIAAGGYKDCKKDNRHTCLEISKVLNPSCDMNFEAFSRWWSRGVGAFVIGKISDAEFLENLDGLYRAFNKVLSIDEAERAFAIIHDTYKELLGISSSATSTGSKPSEMEGPIWNKLFGHQSVPLPASCGLTAEEIDAAASVCQEQKPHIVKHVKAFCKNVLSTGNVGYSWQCVMPLIDESIGAVGSSAELIMCYHDFAFELIENIGGDRGAFWLDAMTDGGEVIAQVGMGRKLDECVDEFSGAFADRVVNLYDDDFDTTDTGALAKDIAVAQSYLASRIAKSLRTESLDLAYLNTARYIVEMIVPNGRYSNRFWSLAVRTLEKSMVNRLDVFEQRSLSIWISQLEAFTGSLSDLEGLAHEIFASAEYSFSARVEEERAIRACVSSVAVACVTLPTAAISGDDVLRAFAFGSELPSFKNAKQLENLFRLIRNTVEEEMPSGYAETLDRLGELFKKLSGLIESSVNGPSVGALNLVVNGSEGMRSYWKAITLSQVENDEGREQIERDVEYLRNCGIEVSGDDHIYGCHEVLRDRWNSLNASSPENRKIMQIALQSFALCPEGNKDLSLFIDTALDKIGCVLGLSALFEASDDFSFLFNAGSELGHSTIFGDQLILGFRVLACRLIRAGLGVKIASRCEELAEDAIGKFESLRRAEPFAGELDKASIHRFLSRVGHHLISAHRVRPGRLFGGIARDIYNEVEVSSVVEAYSACFETVKPVATPIELVHLHQAWLDGQFERSGIASTHWKDVFYTNSVGAELIATFQGECEKLAEKGSAYAVIDYGKGDKNLLQSVLAFQLSSFVTHLGLVGDLEASLELTMQIIDEDLGRVETGLLTSAYKGLIENLDEIVGINSVSFWYLILTQLQSTVCQIGAGRKLHEKLSDVAGKVAERLYNNFSEFSSSHSNKDEGLVVGTNNFNLLLGAMGALMRSSPPTVFELNYGRYVVEVFAAHLEYSKTVLQTGYRYCEELVAESCSWAEKAGLIQVMKAMQGVIGNVPTSKILAQGIYGNRERLFGNSDSEEYRWRNAISGVIAAGITPDGLAAPGKAVMQRLVMSHAIFDVDDEVIWKKKGSELLGIFNQVAANKLPSGVTKRLGEIPGTISILNVVREQKGQGISFFFALFSGLPLAQPMWVSSLLARTNVSTGLEAQGAGDLAISQHVGWDIPDDNKLINHIKTLGAIWAIKDGVEVGPVEEESDKPARGGFFFGKKKKQQSDNTEIVNLDQIKAEAGSVLRALAIKQALGIAGDEKTWLFDTLGAHGNYSKKESEGRIRFYNGACSFINKRFGDKHPLAEAFSNVGKNYAVYSMGRHILNDMEKLSGKVAAAVGCDSTHASGLLQVIGLNAVGGAGFDELEGYLGTSTDNEKSILQTVLDKYDNFCSAMEESLTSSEYSQLDGCVQPLKYQYIN